MPFVLSLRIQDWEKPNNSTLNPRFQPPQEPQREEQPLTPNLCGHKEKKREIRRGVPPLKKKREILKGLLLMEKQGKSSRDNSPMKEVRCERSPKENPLGCMTPFTSFFIQPSSRDKLSRTCTSIPSLTPPFLRLSPTGNLGSWK